MSGLGTRSLTAAAVSVAAVACLVGCGSDGPKVEPILYDGDVTAIPLAGTTSTPVLWEQPSLDGDAADVALDARRFLALMQIVTNGQNRPTGVRISPLLDQLVLPSDPRHIRHDYGDLNEAGVGTASSGSPEYIKVLGVDFFRQGQEDASATISYCSYLSAMPRSTAVQAVNANFGRADRFVSASDPNPDGIVTKARWQFVQYATTPPSYDCAAWAAALPNTSGSS